MIDNFRFIYTSLLHDQIIYFFLIRSNKASRLISDDIHRKKAEQLQIFAAQ